MYLRFPDVPNPKHLPMPLTFDLMLTRTHDIKWKSEDTASMSHSLPTMTTSDQWDLAKMSDSAS